MMSFLDAIACVISRTTHALDVITSISRYDRRSKLLHCFLFDSVINHNINISSRCVSLLSQCYAPREDSSLSDIRKQHPIFQISQEPEDVIYGILRCHQVFSWKETRFHSQWNKKRFWRRDSFATATNVVPTHIVWFTYGECETKTRANVLTNVGNHDTGSQAGGVSFSCIGILL